MVYCGKPSRGCQMCRTRRIKCDETKPTCNQCAKARRQCPGYRDEFDLVLRNENLAAKRRALKGTASRSSRSSSNSNSSSSSSSSSSRSGSENPPSTSPLSAASTLSPVTPTTPNSSSSITTGTTIIISPKSNNPNYPHDPFQHGLPPSPVHLAPETLATCHFLANFVLVPRQQDGDAPPRGFMDYLIPLMDETAMTMTTSSGAGGGLHQQQQQQGKHPHLQHAFNACALASLANRTGFGCSAGVAPSTSSSCLSKAFAEYSRALRATQAALMDPVRCRSDGVLAAVLLLGMFENITAKQIGSLAWGSHVQGAIELVKARGRDQLRTKLGLQLFIAVRTQLIIHTLTSGTVPDMGVEWWMHDAVIDPSAAETQRINLLTSELRAEVTRVMASVVRTPESVKVVQDLMCRAQALDRQVSVWMRSVPEAWRPRTVCWQLHNLGGSDHSRAEVFPGRVDVYTDLYIASVWNMMRTTRLVLMSIAVRCAAWVCSPVDYRTTPEYATAARSCVDTITDILASVPYHLGWHVKREGSSGFACGEDSGMKGLAGYFLSWPLACVMSQDYATDAQRAYVKGRLRYIGEELGIKYAHILSKLQIRLPSMLIRSDGLLAKPYPMAHNIEKLVSNDRHVYPLPGKAQQSRAALPARVTGGAEGDPARFVSAPLLSV